MRLGLGSGLGQGSQSSGGGEGAAPPLAAPVRGYHVSRNAPELLAGRGYGHTEPAAQLGGLTLGHAGRNVYIERETISRQSGGTKHGGLPEVRNRLL